MKLFAYSSLIAMASAGAGTIMLVGRNFDRVVLHKDRRGFIDFPFGGEENYDKDRKASAIRETYEELGVDKRKLLQKLDPLHRRASSGGLYVACYRGDLVKDLGMRADGKIKTSKAGETYAYLTPKIEDVRNGSFERKEGKKIRGFNKSSFKKLYDAGKVKCFEE